MPICYYIYWCGYWSKPNGSTVYTGRGEVVNLNNYMFSLAAASRGAYAIHHVEGGKDNHKIKPTKADEYQWTKQSLAAGARKKFHLFGADCKKFALFFK